jgi:hypothetical protein
MMMMVMMMMNMNKTNGIGLHHFQSNPCASKSSWSSVRRCNEYRPATSQSFHSEHLLPSNQTWQWKTTPFIDVPSKPPFVGNFDLFEDSQIPSIQPVSKVSKMETTTKIETSNGPR